MPFSRVSSWLRCRTWVSCVSCIASRFFTTELSGKPYFTRCSSLVTQIVKNLPAMQETWVQSLGWEDPLEEGMATHSSILAWWIPRDRGALRATVHGVAKSRTLLKYAGPFWKIHLNPLKGLQILVSWNCFQSREGSGEQETEEETNTENGFPERLSVKNYKSYSRTCICSCLMTISYRIVVSNADEL